MDKRTRARELAMQGLYELDVQGAEPIEFLGQFFKENEPDDSICETALKWVKETWANLAYCDELIVDSTLKWKISNPGRYGSRCIFSRSFKDLGSPAEQSPKTSLKKVSVFRRGQRWRGAMWSESRKSCGIAVSR